MLRSTLRRVVARTFPALVVLAASGCKKPSPNLPDGEACTASIDCVSRNCFRGRCTSGQDGAPCVPNIVTTGCKLTFECVAGTCMSPARAVAARAEDEARKERELLAQSGVDVAARAQIAEQPPAPAGGPGARIRVVTTKSKGSAFASCRTDERLTGGSCTGWNLEQNGPTGFGPDDTVGARWSCRTNGREAEITAVALCASTR